jgi:hypothetical protein
VEYRSEGERDGRSEEEKEMGGEKRKSSVPE